MYKNIWRFIIAGLFLVLTISHSALAEHTWYTGYIMDFSKGSIKVDDNRYPVDPEVKVIEQYKKKDSIYEAAKKVEDVLPGQMATIKIENGYVTEIIIIRYR